MKGRRNPRLYTIAAVLFVAAVATSGSPPASVAAASPPAFVQQVSGHAFRVASLALTPVSNITTGNRLIVEVGVWNSAGATAASVSDSAGNPYVELLHYKASEATELSVWTAPVTAGGGSRPTVTVRPTSTADTGAAMLEYAGLSAVADATVVDQMAHATGTTIGATAVASGATPATTAANELALGVYTDSGFGDTLSGDPNYAVRTDVSPTGDMELLAEDAVVAAGATPNATAGTGANTAWLMATIVFKAGSAGAPTVPGAPTGVMAAAGNGSAAVSWTAPPNGGSAITSYTVTPYVGSTAQPATTVSGSPPATSATVSGLTNGTTYTFTVSAINGVGTGPPSAPSNAVTPTATSSGPTIDGSTPVITPATNNVTTVVSGSFSPPAASIIDAAFSMDSYPTDVNARVASVTNSGSPLTWHLKGSENHVGSGVGGFVEVWWAYNPTPQTNITVTGNLAQPTKNVTPPVGALEVIVLRNAAADQSTAAWAPAWDVTGGSAPSATVTTTAPNSLVFAVTNNWDSSVGPTVPPNQTTTINGSAAVVLNPTDQDTYWVQAQNAPTGLAGPVTMNDTAPSVRYHTIAWEVLSAGLPTAPGGQWSSVLSWPIVAIHSVLLKNGNVLVWDGWQQPEPTQVWMPTSQTFATISSPDSIFCSGITQLPDGRVMEAGGYGGLTTGNLGIVDTTVFDPATSSWTRMADMHSPRWYPDLIELADGRYVAISGNSTSPGSWADTPEVYDPATNTWSVLTGISTSQVHEEEYPFSYLVPSGKVFTIGPSEDLSFFLDAANQSWTPVGGASGIRNGSSVMYRPGKIIYSGGAPSVINTTAATANTAVIDLTASTPTWRQTALMANARVYHTLTMLADGTVLAVGGELTSDQEIVTTGVLPSEIWNPATETWTTVASMGAARNYHSTAVLMPDGRVLVAGGGHSNGLSGAGQFSAQIYSPPYLFQGPRPTISAAPTGATYNSSISVSTPDASSISTVNLVSLGADTHQADMNQHFVPLSFTTGSGALNVQMPGSAALAPPGNYMLFIVNGSGVPSVASFIHLGVALTAPSAPTNVTAVAGNAQATVSWTPPASNGGSAITGYTVTSAPGGVTASAGASATSAVVSPLVNGTTYTFTVTATNAIGTSSPSASSNAVTPTAPTAPGPPTNVSAVAGNAQATVSWTPPASNGGSAITGYTVTSAPGGVTASAGASATSAVVSPLVNGTTYTFTVTATNAVGTSGPSAASNSVIPTAPTAPGPPTNVSAVAGNAQATVSWTPPASNGGSAITGYTVTSSPGGVTASAGASATSAVVSPLVNGTTYTFTVTASNAFGTSSPSAPSNAVTPSAPAIAFVQQVGGHRLAVASISVTPATNLTTGNRLIVLVGVWNYGNPTTRSVTDSAGNSYTELLHFVASDGTEQSVWSAPITRGGGTRPTITATPTANADLGIVVLEYAGLSSASGVGAVDQQAHASGTTGSATTVRSGATAATTAANELAVGFYVDSGFGDTLSYGTGFTGRANVSPAPDMEMVVEDAIVAAGATPNAGAGTGANTTWLMTTIVFKAGP